MKFANATIRETAAHYRVSPRTVRDWLDRGIAKGIKVGGVIRITHVIEMDTETHELRKVVPPAQPPKRKIDRKAINAYLARAGLVPRSNA